MRAIVVVLSALAVVATCLPHSGVRPKRQHGMAFSGFYDMSGLPEETEVQQEPGAAVPDRLANVEGSTQVNEVVPQAQREASAEQASSEEEEEDAPARGADPWSWFARSGRQPAINFFPIAFGGVGGSRSSGAGAPPSSVAIANSWSTGQRGVAMSNAVANGDPEMLFRKANPA